MRGCEIVNNSETYSEPCRTTRIEIFKKKVNSWKLLTSLEKSPILDVRLGSEYVSETLVPHIHRTRIHIIILKKWLLTCHFQFLWYCFNTFFTFLAWSYSCLIKSFIKLRLLVRVQQIPKSVKSYPFTYYFDNMLTDLIYKDALFFKLTQVFVFLPCFPSMPNTIHLFSF